MKQALAMTSRIARTAPVTDREAAAAAGQELLEELAQEIMAMPRPAAAQARHGRWSDSPRKALLRFDCPRRASVRFNSPRRTIVRFDFPRRSVLLFAAAAALATAAVLTVAPSGPPSLQQLSVGSAGAEALSFRTEGRYLDILVRNPLADPARYRAEFAAHHLDVSLKLLPASPSLVGTLVFYEGGSRVKPLSAVGRCFTGGGGNVCPVGVRIPDGYAGHVAVVFGRAARPGEQYESAADATAPGEALHGLTIDGQRVSAVLDLLRGRNVAVSQWRSERVKGPIGAAQVPGSWFVYDATAWAPGSVLLFVGPTPHPVPSPAGTAGSGPQPFTQPGKQ